MFGVACIACLFTLRFGIVCGAIGCILSCPLFYILASTIPWGSVISIAPYGNWRYTFSAMLVLIISAAHSSRQLWLLFRSRAAR